MREHAADGRFATAITVFSAHGFSSPSASRVDGALIVQCPSLRPGRGSLP